MSNYVREGSGSVYSNPLLLSWAVSLESLSGLFRLTGISGILKGELYGQYLLSLIHITTGLLGLHCSHCAI